MFHSSVSNGLRLDTPTLKSQSGSATNLRVGDFVSLSSIYSVISLADVHLHYVCNRQKKVEAILEPGAQAGGTQAMHTFSL